MSTNAFLSLPAELRNQIIAYALTSSTSTLQYNSPLSLRQSKPVFEDIHDPGREFNQLKYVCKQLYDETAGLEVRYNALRFELPEDDAYTLARIQNVVDSGYAPSTLSPIPSASFPPFLYTCSQSRVAWLQDIIITIRKPASYSLSQPTVDRLLSLAKFTNPGVNITYEYIDEVYEYKAPKYQQVVPWLSVAICLGVALPLPVAWKPAAEIVGSLCGRGNLLFWSLGFGIWDLMGNK